MRHHADWLAGFLDYAKYGEAPRHMYFWSGVSAIAGALQRKVWIDQAYFRWYPNFYICLVAPPGIVAKSTTTDVAMKLLERVPGIKFGPDVVTWPALIEAFAGSREDFEIDGTYYPMSAMTLAASEFGNLLDPQDKQMVDLLVSLWDGKQGSFKKQTKTSGNDEIVNPWINMIACTTPSWVAGNFPEYMIGGGFTSRTVFVYADTKYQYVSYPGRVVPPNLSEMADRLVEDLIEISNLKGQFTLTEEAYAWGDLWYKDHFSKRPSNLDPERFGGYFARKQTHIHKLAMVLSASESDSLIITKEHLSVANAMVTDLEPDMSFVFSKIGRSDNSLYIEKLVVYVHSRGVVSYEDAFRYVHSHFPSFREFEDALLGCVRAGYLELQKVNGIPSLVARGELPSTKTGKAA